MTLKRSIVWDTLCQFKEWRTAEARYSFDLCTIYTMFTVLSIQEDCKKIFEEMMTLCDDRGHDKYALRLVERWAKRAEWCSSFSISGEEAADLTNNFCESAFR